MPRHSYLGEQQVRDLLDGVEDVLQRLGRDPGRAEQLEHERTNERASERASERTRTNVRSARGGTLLARFVKGILRPSRKDDSTQDGKQK